MRVPSRVIGVSCERVSRTQFGKRVDPGARPGAWIFTPPWGAGLCCSCSLAGSQLLLEPAPITSAPPTSASSSTFCSLECFAFCRPIFTTPAGSPLSASAFLSDESFSPSNFPGRPPGLPDYQSYCSVRTVCSRAPPRMTASLWTVCSWVT